MTKYTFMERNGSDTFTTYAATPEEAWQEAREALVDPILVSRG